MSNSLMKTYARLPVAFKSGKSVYLTDTEGNEYLDALCGIAVCSLGHAHPDIADAIADQARTLIHTSNLYEIPNQTELSEKLCHLSGMGQVFFANSGAEANEAAIKLARLFGKQQGIEKPVIIVATGSFHGRTLATLSATGNPKIQDGFDPLVEGFVHVPYNDIIAIKEVAINNPNVVAILVEPVQGEGGVIVPDSDYLSNIRQICNENNWLMMLDEIQTGIGRTGKWFAFQHSENSKPDVMTLAKALGNGVPIGACLASGKANDVFSPGKHGTTFGGNPLAMRAALTVLHIIETQNLCNNAGNMGKYLVDQFKQSLSDDKGLIDGVSDIRGHGLMIGIELEKDCAELVVQALDYKILINVTADRTIRLLPALITTKEQADKIINTVSILVKTFL
ncbi:MAG: aspartate aminotransferase family protein [Cocleimonas sp.]